MKFDRPTQPIRRPKAEEDRSALPPHKEQYAAEQDEIPTPTPVALPPGGQATPPPVLSTPPRVQATPPPVLSTPPRVQAGPPHQRSNWTLWSVVGLCLVISITSLALNAVLIHRLLGLRQAAVEGVDTAIDALDNLGGFHYEYRFQQTIPFSGDVPFKQDMLFPFKGDIPINTTVRVPIDAGVLGTMVFDVPIDMTFPVDVEVPVHVDQTFHVDTEIPVDMTIPVDIGPDDPAIRGLLDQVRQWLVELRGSL
jgi:hypothetical protein